MCFIGVLELTAYFCHFCHIKSDILTSDSGLSPTLSSYACIELWGTAEHLKTKDYTM